MKKVIFIALAALFTLAAVSYPAAESKAQTVKLTTKTLSAATDTTAFTNVGSKVKAFQYTFTKSGSTPSGKVYLEATINGTWVAIDSLTITDVSTAQTKVTAITSTTYLSYRYRNSAALTGAIRLAYIRRTDE